MSLLQCMHPGSKGVYKYSVPCVCPYNSYSYKNIKLAHIPNIFRSFLNSFYFESILKYLLVKKLLLYRVTNKIGEINHILNNPKSVRYKNIKLDHFPNSLRSIVICE